MELTIPKEGMYRMWYVKTGVLKKKKPSDIQTYLHTWGSKNYLQYQKSRVQGEILKPGWLSRTSLFSPPHTISWQLPNPDPLRPLVCVQYAQNSLNIWNCSYQFLLEDHLSEPLEVQRFESGKNKKWVFFVIFGLLDGSLWIRDPHGGFGPNVSAVPTYRSFI